MKTHQRATNYSKEQIARMGKALADGGFWLGNFGQNNVVAHFLRTLTWLRGELADMKELAREIDSNDTELHIKQLQRTVWDFENIVE